MKPNKKILETAERVTKIDRILSKEFPHVETPLIHKNAFELLAATMLSAQTPDVTTNKATPGLFKKYPDAKSLASADPDEVAEYIKTINYYKTKSRNLVKMANILIEKFGGEVPKTMETLIEIPGVGRKIANVVISEWFRRPEGFVVDTHVKRVSFRLGLTENTDPSKVEQDLMQLFPKEKWIDTSLRFIFHGRKTCKSQKPLCSECPLREICPRVGVYHPAE